MQKFIDHRVVHQSYLPLERLAKDVSTREAKVDSILSFVVCLSNEQLIMCDKRLFESLGRHILLLTQ